MTGDSLVVVGMGIAVLTTVLYKDSRMVTRIDALGTELRASIDALRTELRASIDALGRDLGGRIDAQGARIDALAGDISVLGERTAKLEGRQFEGPATR